MMILVMPKSPTAIEVTEDQVLWFRARRGHLAGPGAATAVAAARAILGAQAQQLPPALLALSLRTRGRPTAAALEKHLFRSPRKLVWTWGQRGTLHMYDPKDDWAAIVAARAEWAPGERVGPMPTAAAIAKAREVIRAAPGPITRSDLVSVAPRSYVRAIEERARAANLDPRRLAAARLFWCLAQEGDACVAENIGSERAYAARSAWFPDLAWPETPASTLEAAAFLTRRYLAVYGPATATDVGHFFGARVRDARAGLAELDRDLIPVSCGGRKGLVALEEDVDDLTANVPTTTAEWPLRLLPLWESMLMAHADKTWTVPDETERKPVWRKAAYVSAVVLARGRVVATWTHTKRAKRLDVEITPLSGWRKTKHGAATRREAKTVARHLGLEAAEVCVKC